MLTNESFELTPAQLQSYHDWISEYGEGLRLAGEDDLLGEVSIVFTFTSIGRHVVARIPDSSKEIVLEDFLDFLS